MQDFNFLAFYTYPYLQSDHLFFNPAHGKEDPSLPLSLHVFLSPTLFTSLPRILRSYTSREVSWTNSDDLDKLQQVIFLFLYLKNNFISFLKIKSPVNYLLVYLSIEHTSYSSDFLGTRSNFIINFDALYFVHRIVMRIQNASLPAFEQR